MRSKSLTGILCAVFALLPTCGSVPGMVTVQFEWAGQPPALTFPLYAFARVDQESGDPSQVGTTVLAGTGPVKYEGTSVDLNFGQIVNGHSLVLEAELRQGPAPDSPVLFDGVSKPFSLEPGTRTRVVVVLQPLVAPPDTGVAGNYRYVRVPWGDHATGGASSFTVLGAAGAAPPGAVAMAAYDGPTLAGSNEIGRGAVDALGSFQIVLQSVDRAAVYVASVDAAGNRSSPVPVHDVAWTASFGGKLPGSTAANPHFLLAEPGAPLAPTAGWAASASAGAQFHGDRTPAPALAPEPATYEALSPVSATPFGTTGALAWTNATPFPVPVAPGARNQHAMAYDTARGATVLFGGANGVGPLGDTWEWDGFTWTAFSPPVGPQARFAHALAYDSARGVTVLFGGLSNMGALDDTWLWNGADWVEMSTPVHPSARFSHSMVYDAARGVTVLFGGVATQPSNSCETAVTLDNETAYFCNDVWEWNGDAWANVTPPQPASAPVPRLEAGMAYDSSRGVSVVFGGQAVDRSACPTHTADGIYLCADTWEWDGIRWADRTSPTPAPSARESLAMFYDSTRGVTFLFGGYSVDGSGCTSGFCSDTWAWDGTAWTRMSPSDSPVGRGLAGAVYDAARSTPVLFGGDTAADGGNCSVVTDNPGKFYLCGDTWEWAGAGWIQAALPVPAARGYPAMDYDSARGRSVLFGGATSQPGSGCDVSNGFSGYVCDDTWEWDGTGWIRMEEASGPSARQAHSMAYDSARGRSVLFGGDAVARSTDCPRSDGTGDHACDDTWEWDGATWTQSTTPIHPSPRFSAAMTYDSARGVTVLFGGVTHTLSPGCRTPLDVLGTVLLLCNDTWEWDGTSWVERAPPTPGPSPRSAHALVYDAVRGVTVLFGGVTATSVGAEQAFANDTWEWDGINWTSVATTGPPARGYPVMAFDTTQEVALLLGGATTQSNPDCNTAVASSLYLCDDTWAWNGASWSQQFPVNPPPGRAHAAMIFDTLRGAMTLFGGATPSGFVSDTWLLVDAADRPADLAEFDFAATGETFAAAPLESISFTSNAGGAGATSALPPASGAALAAWDNSSGGGWMVVATNTASASDASALDYTTSSPWEAEHFALSGPWQSIAFAVLPVEPSGNGTNPGAVALGDPELTVEYRHTESACASGSDAGCVCAADETACVSDGGSPLCSDVALDPLNCGGCAGTGKGAICAEGWCVDGACSCPSLDGGVETMCEGSCTDTMRDPVNCGGCSSDGGVVCAPGDRCVAGACVAALDGGLCHTDWECPGSAAPVCNVAAGLCVQCASNADCPLAAPWCDANGSCAQCVLDSQCLQGTCTAGICQPCPGIDGGIVIGCSGVCTNIAADSSNCGRCGLACSAGTSCAQGACQ